MNNFKYDLIIDLDSFQIFKKKEMKGKLDFPMIMKTNIKQIIIKNVLLLEYEGIKKEKNIIYYIKFLYMRFQMDVQLQPKVLMLNI